MAPTSSGSLGNDVGSGHELRCTLRSEVRPVYISSMIIGRNGAVTWVRVVSTV